MISSIHNTKIQQMRQLLARRKVRDASNSFVVEGVRLLEEAFHAGWKPDAIYYSENLSQRGRVLLDDYSGQKVECEQVREDILHQVSDTETSQGILAVFERQELPIPERLDFILILDQLKDPGNMGSILRAASAAGVQATILTPGTTEVFSPKVLRAGMGAQFRLPVRVFDWVKIDQLLNKEEGEAPRLYLTSSHADASCWEVDLNRPAAILIGSEADGASKEAEERCFKRIGIPMPGYSESLNAAVAAGILLFEVVRQRSQ